jgi:hypothetical protein
MMQMAGVTTEQQQQFLDHHSPQQQAQRLQGTEDLKSHPEFQRLQQWQAQRQVGSLDNPHTAYVQEAGSCSMARTSACSSCCRALQYRALMQRLHCSLGV